MHLYYRFVCRRLACGFSKIVWHLWVIFICLGLSNGVLAITEQKPLIKKNDLKY